jgi:hypothetical protein
MVYKKEDWLSRITNRSDLTSVLTHLTKPICDTKGLSEDKINELATKNLIKILHEGEIKGSTTEKGFIKGSIPAVCFQDVPIYGLVQNVEHELQRRRNNPNERYRYCGVGMAFNKRYIFERGGRPVIYEQTKIAEEILPEKEYWRIVNLDIGMGKEHLIDWTHEREWRLPNKLEFIPQAAHILLYDKICWDFFIDNCPKEFIKQIHGVTLLRRVLL